MTKELDEWFEFWWKSLPSRHFTSQNKGSKAEAKMEIGKLNPDTELREKIMWYTKERALRYAKMGRDHKLPGWRHAVRLVRYRFWDDELPNAGDTETKRENVQFCECKAPATHLNKCERCHFGESDKERDRMLYANLVGIGLAKLKSETKNEYANRCKAAIKSRGMGKALAERTTSNA